MMIMVALFVITFVTQTTIGLTCFGESLELILICFHEALESFTGIDAHMSSIIVPFSIRDLDPIKSLKNHVCLMVE